MQSVPTPVIISIEGSIGAGKSTLLRTIENHYKNNSIYIEQSDIIFMQEPVHLWMNTTDDEGKGILEKFYEDPPKYAFQFQVLVLTTIIKTLSDIIRDNPACKIIVCERSVESSNHVFMKMLHDNGTVDSVSYNIYNQLYDTMHTMYCTQKILYLHSTPELCYERVTQRNRDGENNITLEYLVSCDLYHTKWLSNIDIGKEIFDIDINDDSLMRPETPVIKKIVTFINSFIH